MSTVRQGDVHGEKLIEALTLRFTDSILIHTHSKLKSERCAYLPVVRWTQCPQKQPSLRAKRLNFAAEAMSFKRWRRFLRWLTALAQVYINIYYIFCIVFAFAFWFTKPRMIDHIYDRNAKLLFYFFKDGWRNQQKWGRTPKSEFAKSKRKLVFKSSSWNVVCS